MDKDKIGLLARAITTAIIAILGVLTILGVNIPVINENTLTAVISGVLYVAVLIWNHWKNNNYTIEAKIGQSVVNELKATRKYAGSEPYGDVISHELNDPGDERG